MATERTDMGTGLGVLFGLLALAGAGAMYAGAPDTTTVSAGGFAAAVAFGCLAIVAIHVHGG